MEATEDWPCFSNPLIFFVFVEFRLAAISTPFFVF
jgi:hypothetical protein